MDNSGGFLKGTDGFLSRQQSLRARACAGRLITAAWSMKSARVSVRVKKFAPHLKTIARIGTKRKAVIAEIYLHESISPRR